MGIVSGEIQVERSKEKKLWHKNLFIDPGSMYDCIIPEDIQSLWGPIPLERLPIGMDNNCKAITHK